MPIELTAPPHDVRLKTDWSQYADGKPREFERGVDFDCDPYSFSSRARHWARQQTKHGRGTYKVTATKRGDNMVITLTLLEGTA